MQHSYEEPLEEIPLQEREFEIRKRAYLNAVNAVRNLGLSPRQAIVQMYEQTPEWRDVPLEQVLNTILGPAQTSSGAGLPGHTLAGERAIWKAAQDYSLLAPAKKTKSSSITSKPSKHHEVFFEEDEEGGDEDEDEEEVVTEEEEENGEDESSWLETVKTKEVPIFKQIKQKYLPAVTYPFDMPRPPVSKYDYHLWVYNGKNYVPLVDENGWIGSNSSKEAILLAQQHPGSVVWPKKLQTNVFNLWTQDANGKWIPVIWEHENSLVHLGKDNAAIASKMVVLLHKKHNINSVILPKNQTDYMGQKIGYYTGRRR